MATKWAARIKPRLLDLQRQKFVRDENGATAVEFGLLAVPFFMIIGALLETSLIFLSGQILESAVHDVSRLIRTGEVRELRISTINDFKARVCDRVFGLIRDCNTGLHVEVDVVVNFSNATITPPIDMAACTTNAANCNWGASRPEKFLPGQGSSIIVVQVYYKWPTVIGVGGYNLSDLKDGTRLMGASTVFRNEPYT